MIVPAFVDILDLSYTTMLPRLCSLYIWIEK